MLNVEGFANGECTCFLLIKKNRKRGGGKLVDSLERLKAMKIITSILMILLVYGCTTTNQAMLRANNTFVGKNIDEFVLTHGIPYRKYQLNSGDFIYIWSSGVISYTMPTTTSVTGSSTPYGYNATAITQGGEKINVFCEVQIHTTSEGKIISIKPIKDTLGNWTTSRCSEIFK